MATKVFRKLNGISLRSCHVIEIYNFCYTFHLNGQLLIKKSSMYDLRHHCIDSNTPLRHGISLCRFLGGLEHIWPGFNSKSWRSISRDVSLADHTLPTCPDPAWQKMAQTPLNGTTQPVDIEEEG